MLLHAAEHHGVRRGGRHALHVRRPSWRASGSPSAAWATASRCATPTSATSTTVRTTPSARSACSSTSACRSSTRYFTRCRVAVAAARAGSLNHGISRPHHAGEDAPPPLGAGRLDRNFTERYVFPDGELHEIGNVVSADPARRVRGPAHGEPARALRAHPAVLGPQPRGRLGRTRWRRSGPAARACGGSTWRPPRWASSTTTTRCTRCSPPRRPAATAACPAAPVHLTAPPDPAH